MLSARRAYSCWSSVTVGGMIVRAASTISPRGADPMPYVDALRSSAEVVLPAPWPAPAAIPEETEKVLRWLESDGVRLVHVEGEWSCPVGGATKHLRLHDLVQESRADLVPFDDRRNLRTDPRPVP